jgi:hypothetical protein
VTADVVDPIREPRLPGLRVLLRRTWWAAIGLAVGLVGGLVVGAVRSPVYETTGYVTVTATGGPDATSVARTAQALARLAASPSIVSPALEDAGLPEVATQPRLHVTVQAAPDAPIISVTGLAADPDDAQRIVLTVTRVLAGVHTLGAAYTVSELAAPPLPTEPTTPGWALPAGGAATGLAVAVVLAATVPVRRTRERYPLETALA